MTKFQLSPNHVILSEVEGSYAPYTPPSLRLALDPSTTLRMTYLGLVGKQCVIGCEVEPTVGFAQHDMIELPEK